MKGLGELLKVSASYLEERGIARSRRDVEELFSHLLKIRRIDLYLNYDRPLEEGEISQLREGVKRLGKGEPVEYVVEEVEFAGCHLRIDRRALIPRPETEVGFYFAVERLKGREEGVAWDLCTGSGCLGIALKKRFPKMRVTLSDLSPEALSLAKENVAKNGVEIEVVQGDLFAPFQGKKTDLLFCNPPYISKKELLDLTPSVREFEPHLALIGGERGWEFYERIAREAPPYLAPGALLFLEIGAGQGEVVPPLFQPPVWKGGEVVRDWAGHPRFFFVEKQ